MTDLALPDFLRVAPGSRRMPRPRKWTRLVAQRPEGERWENAERWEITVPPEVPQLAPGARYVWVSVGRKWAHLRDAQDHAKLPIREWERLSNKGRRVDIPR